MMVLDTSKTGLMPITYARRTDKKEHIPKLEFQKCIQPAALSVKPYSALLNPFRKGCSIFCNHPTSDTDLKMMIKKSKMKKDDDKDDMGVDRKALAERVGDVLEEMLCRHKRNSSDEDNDLSSLDESNSPQMRPVLVLDLMRAASQETLSTTMGGRGTGGLQSTNMSPVASPISIAKSLINKIPVTPASDNTFSKQDTEGDRSTDGGIDDEGELQKRRGKIKKKKKKQTSNNLDDKNSREVVGLLEPGETQISAWKDGDDLSWRGSSNATPLPTVDLPDPECTVHLTSDIFDDPTLRHLRRSLTVQQAEGEFRRIVRRYWRNVLFEALAASNMPPDVEPIVPKELVPLPPSNPDLWKEYPREFKYSSARFDIPISKATLNGMASLNYLQNYVVVAKEFKLLYNHVFMQFREIPNADPPWFMLGKDIFHALAQVMGRRFTEAEALELQHLVNWKEDDHIDLRTWNGIAALTERVFGLRFSTAADPHMGERQVIEQVDFGALNKRKHLLKLKPDLKALLEAVQNVKTSRNDNNKSIKNNTS